MVLKFAYIGLAVLMLLLIIFAGVKTINKTFTDKSVVRKKIFILVGALVAWQLYIFILGSQGILLNYDFPPRFFLLLILPAFIFTGIFISKNRNNQWIHNIPQQWLIYIQSFRILIEALFVFSVAQGALHHEVTIEGYNYDMIFAATAPIISFLVFQKKLLSRKAALIWNFVGLGVIVEIIFLFLSTTYLPHIYGSTISLLPKNFGSYPFVLVPGFLMPLAVFIHVLSIVQLSKSALRSGELASQL